MATEKWWIIQDLNYKVPFGFCCVQIKVKSDTILTGIKTIVPFIEIFLLFTAEIKGGKHPNDWMVQLTNRFEYVGMTMTKYAAPFTAQEGLYDGHELLSGA